MLLKCQSVSMRTCPFHHNLTEITFHRLSQMDGANEWKKADKQSAMSSCIFLNIFSICMSTRNQGNVYRRHTHTHTADSYLHLKMHQRSSEYFECVCVCVSSNFSKAKNNFGQHSVKRNGEMWYADGQVEWR